MIDHRNRPMEGPYFGYVRCVKQKKKLTVISRLEKSNYKIKHLKFKELDYKRNQPKLRT